MGGESCSHRSPGRGSGSSAWSTMSIVAWIRNGEVGGAGASCLQGQNGGVFIISDLQTGQWACIPRRNGDAGNQQMPRANAVGNRRKRSWTGSTRTMSKATRPSGNTAPWPCTWIRRDRRASRDPIAATIKGI